MIDPELLCWHIVANVVKEARGRYGLTLYATVYPDDNGFIMKWIAPEVNQKFGQMLSYEFLTTAREPVEQASQRMYNQLRVSAEMRDKR